MASKKKETGYIIRADNGKGKVIYYGRDNARQDDWTDQIRSAQMYKDEEELYMVYEQLYRRENRHDPNTFNVFKGLEIVKLEISYKKFDLDEDRLKSIRQKQALRKLSVQDVMDLGIEEIATIHKLEHDAEVEGYEILKSIPEPVGLGSTSNCEDDMKQILQAITRNPQ